MKTVKKSRRISVLLSVEVDLKVGDQADIKNLIERLECNCMEMSGEEAEVVGIKIMDRKLLLEAEEED